MRLRMSKLKNRSKHKSISEKMDEKRGFGLAVREIYSDLVNVGSFRHATFPESPNLVEIVCFPLRNFSESTNHCAYTQ